MGLWETLGVGRRVGYLHQPGEQAQHLGLQRDCGEVEPTQQIHEEQLLLHQVGAAHQTVLHLAQDAPERALPDLRQRVTWGASRGFGGKLSRCPKTPNTSTEAQHVPGGPPQPSPGANVKGDARHRCCRPRAASSTGVPWGLLGRARAWWRGVTRARDAAGDPPRSFTELRDEPREHHPEPRSCRRRRIKPPRRRVRSHSASPWKLRPSHRRFRPGWGTVPPPVRRSRWPVPGMRVATGEDEPSAFGPLDGGLQLEKKRREGAGGNLRRTGPAVHLGSCSSRSAALLSGLLLPGSSARLPRQRRGLGV